MLVALHALTVAPLLVAATDPDRISFGVAGLLVAALAGLLSFLSPCVLPLVPSYVAFITGASAVGATSETVVEQVRDRRPMLLGVSFVLGFSAVFVALGATATALGSSVRVNGDVVSIVGGVVLVLLGMVLVGLLRIPGMDRDTRALARVAGSRQFGYGTSFVVGAAFAAGWTPCIGPVLAGILTIAATGDTVWQGVALLAAYSAGLAVPFLLATAALDRFVVVSGWFRRWLPWVNRVSGVLLILLGLLLVSGLLAQLSSWAARFTPGWIG